MSNPLTDQVSDYVHDQKIALLEEYLEGVEGGDNFLGWFLCEYPEVKREELFKMYLEHKSADKFYTWATTKAYDVLANEE